MKKIIALAVSVLFLTSFKTEKLSSQDVFSNNKVVISVSTVGCNDVKNGTNREYIFLSFTNKTSKTIEVSFFTEIYYSNKCYSCGNPEEYTHKITLSPNQTLTGDCSNKTTGNSIFSKMLDGATTTKLTKYSIQNVSVKTK